MSTARKITEKDPIILKLLKDPRYKVRADGRVLTTACRGGHGIGPWRLAGWVSPSRGGEKLYRRLQYKGHDLYEHRIAVLARGERLSPYETVNHKDLNGLNNGPVNTEPATPSQNMRHARAMYKRLGMSAAEVKRNWIKGLAGASSKSNGEGASWKPEL